MRIDKPIVRLVEQGIDIEAHIAQCARVCYASDKTNNNEQLCENLIKRRHYSMFRHAGVYYKIPANIPLSVESNAGVYFNIIFTPNYTYVSTNKQFAIKHMQDYAEYEVDWLTAINDEVFYKFKMIYYTFIIDTGIDITREFNRKSPNAIAERSTRYIDFIKKIGIVFKRCHWMYNLNLYRRLLVKFICKVDEWFYKISRSKYGLNLKPEDARWCLFLDTMSKVAYTYTVKEWEYIINLRLFDWTGPAHPDAKIIAQDIKSLLEDEGYVIENYIEQENARR